MQLCGLLSVRTAVEHLFDLQYSLQMLEFPLSMETMSLLYKVPPSLIPNWPRDGNALSHHWVCENIAQGWLVFKHLSGKLNPSDCLTTNLAAP